MAYALQKRWLERCSSKLFRQKMATVEWLSREELGETNGRFHLHLLLGGIRDAARVNPKTCLACMGQWEAVTEAALGRAAMARVRTYQPDLCGAGYVLKGLTGADVSLRGANAYELSKLGTVNQTVRLARAAAVVWQRQKGFKYATQARSRRESVSVKCGL